MSSKSIAIDGPAGAGKSTIAKKIAEKLEYIYIDTGAMYRAFGLYCINQEIDGKDSLKVSNACEDIIITIEYVNGEQQVILNGKNVSKEIRNDKVGEMASFVSSNKDVRLKLVELQRELANSKNVVMDGRDIGTYVLPDATLKIYLTASVKERARRRWKEYNKKNIDCNIQEIEEDIKKRDERDMTREFAPLKQAQDAIEIDSSNLTIDEVVSKIIMLFKNNI